MCYCNDPGNMAGTPVFPLDALHAPTVFMYDLFDGHVLFTQVLTSSRVGNIEVPLCTSLKCTAQHRGLCS